MTIPIVLYAACPFNMNEEVSQSSTPQSPVMRNLAHNFTNLDLPRLGVYGSSKMAMSTIELTTTTAAAFAAVESPKRRPSISLIRSASSATGTSSSLATWLCLITVRFFGIKPRPQGSHPANRDSTPSISDTSSTSSASYTTAIATPRSEFPSRVTWVAEPKSLHGLGIPVQDWNGQRSSLYSEESVNLSLTDEVLQFPVVVIDRFPAPPDRPMLPSFCRMPTPLLPTQIELAPPVQIASPSSTRKIRRKPVPKFDVEVEDRILPPATPVANDIFAQHARAVSHSRTASTMTTSSVPTISEEGSEPAPRPIIFHIPEPPIRRHTRASRSVVDISPRIGSLPVMIPTRTSSVLPGDPVPTTPSRSGRTAWFVSKLPRSLSSSRSSSLLQSPEFSPTPTEGSGSSISSSEGVVTPALWDSSKGYFAQNPKWSSSLANLKKSFSASVTMLRLSE